MSAQLASGPGLGVSNFDEEFVDQTSKLGSAELNKEESYHILNRRLVNVVLDEVPAPPLNTNRIESSPRPVSQLLEEERPEESSKVQEAAAPQPAHASGWSSDETERLQSHKDATSSRETGKAPLGKGFRGYLVQDSLSSQAHAEQYRAAFRSGSIGSCLEWTVSNDGLDMLQGRPSELGAHLHGKEQLTYLFTEQRRLMNDFFESLDMDQVHTFTQLCLSCQGVLIFTGVGKSGFIAQKVSQTLVSTGTKALFLSPTDALHGDIGIIGPKDILVLFSKSGATEELTKLAPYAKAKGAYLVAVTSCQDSKLGRICNMHVHLPLERELCPFNLAPVTSTTIQMLFGDTVAIALMQAKHLTREQYAKNHPAGRIGKRLILRVQDVMKKGAELPLCAPEAPLMDMLVELTQKGCGCLLVTDQQKKLLGTFTDGDLRRSLNRFGSDVMSKRVGELMNENPRAVPFDSMAVEALQQMETSNPVTFLPVVDTQRRVTGLVTLHGLVAAGL
ncbi:sugar isomerase [Klebsormidium nitens]|uniref:Sugar isomerase n=1 Tax=Klebsormidium nitens TaxID=105231 RepID=A0A1Y1I435_KLENI|nr:sugar isomerase [Klebsormidium nitens]|eukprot:GAQ83507.1 sugar isomerase [Klebsormidium nitens]